MSRRHRSRKGGTTYRGQVTALRKIGPALAVPALTVLALTACRPGDPAAAGHPHHTATPPPAATHAAGRASPAAGSNDPARSAKPVRTYAAAAGIDARLLMAILYSESYKPHDPTLERAWQKLNPDAAFGVANMHRGTFDDTKRGRDFA